MSGPSDEQKTLVEESWNIVKEFGAAEVGVQIFKTIFEMAPSALDLFFFYNEPDLYNSYVMKWHGANFVNHVGYAVAGLREPETLVRMLHKLGDKHNDRKIRRVHFKVGGEALMATLADRLGDKLTPEVSDAWLATYNTIADLMMSQMKGLDDTDEEEKK